MKKSLWIYFCFISIAVQGQVDINFELQAYPTGIIPGLRIEKCFAKKNATIARFGYQWIRHRDLGVHEDERGNGYGFSLGYKRYLKTEFVGWAISGKIDLWKNRLDWMDNISSPSPTMGETEILVLQPTIELSFLMLKKSRIVVSPTIALGFEWNIETMGAEVGQGAILLVGINIGYRH